MHPRNRAQRITSSSTSTITPPHRAVTRRAVTRRAVSRRAVSRRVARLRRAVALSRILLTGASGNIGTALLRHLAAHSPDLEIAGVVRRRPPTHPPYDCARWHTVDLAELDAADQLAPLMVGADAVVHLA